MKDPLHESALITANGVKELRDENSRLATQVNDLMHQVSALESELKLRKEAHERDLYELGYYRAYCIEITTQLSTLRVVIEEIEAKANAAGYAPENNPRPKLEAVEKIAEEELPKFLTEESNIKAIPTKQKIDRRV